MIANYMREPRFELGRPVRAADPKSTPTFNKERKRRAPAGGTERHGVAPEGTDHMPADVTSDAEVLVRGADVKKRGGLIYGLVDPRQPSRVRYVGQTTGHPNARYRQHLPPRRLRAPVDRCARSVWFRGLLEIGVYPDMVLLERVPDAGAWELTERERQWIAKLRRKGQADLNAPLPQHWLARRQGGKA